MSVDDARRLCRAMGVSLVDLVGPEAARELRIGPLRPGTGQGD